MRKNPKSERQPDQRAKPPRLVGRRSGNRRTADLERRLGDVEALAGASQRELELQFQRIADMQAELDMLLRRVTMPARSAFHHEKTEGYEQKDHASVDPLVAAVPSVPIRPGS